MFVVYSSSHGLPPASEASEAVSYFNLLSIAHMMNSHSTCFPDRDYSSKEEEFQNKGVTLVKNSPQHFDQAE